MQMIHDYSDSDYRVFKTYSLVPLRICIHVTPSYATLNRFITEAPIVPWSVVSPARDSDPVMWVLIQSNKCCSSVFYTKNLVASMLKMESWKRSFSRDRQNAEHSEGLFFTSIRKHGCTLGEYLRSIIQSQSLAKIVRFQLPITIIMKNHSSNTILSVSSPISIAFCLFLYLLPSLSPHFISRITRGDLEI